MTAYMRNLFPYFGINRPERELINKEIFPQIKAVASEAFLKEIASLCWQKSEREYHYFALDLLSKHIKLLNAQSLSWLLELAVRHAWWDSIDFLAIKVIGKLVLNFPELAERMEELSVHENKWLRRIAIIHQIPFKKNTDEKKLFQYCLYNASDTDFFIRKAIGWALREYGKTNPTAVVAFVEKYNDLFSNLTKKEALRRII
jgi:3-methyladenine DNA glycosylase AlkD